MLRSGLFLLLAFSALAQDFEVASVKAATPPNAGAPPMVMKGGPGTGDPGQITWNNVTMRTVLLRAYGIRNYQLVAPKWTDAERYDIAAKIPPGASPEEFRAMLQNLLKERFKLQARQEEKESPVYSLLVGKNGPKLQESKQIAPPETPAAPVQPGGRIRLVDGFPPLPPGPGMAAILLNGGWRLSARAQSMINLADYLSSQMSRQVNDLTGLKGVYDFHLVYLPENMMAARPPGAEPRPDSEDDVFTALAQQLGLKLEPGKGPVRMVFVDALEKVPTEN